MVSSSMPPPSLARVAARVSSIELLLDLVFVFTISQLAEILVVDPTWDALAQTAVLMAVIWWMYDAFAWLTNQARPDTTTERLLLIGAMAAFLVMSLAVPDAFGDSGVVFAVSYLVVVAIHAGVFISSGGPAAARAMRRVLLTNTAVGALLLAAAFVHGAADWVLFVAPFGLFVVAGVISRRSGAFELGASHFVERHGLLMIIALGESIVSVGAGLAGHELDAAVIIGAIATVAVVATLWWSYFAGTDDERATETLGAAPAAERTSVALTAFYGAHLVMLLGLVVLAAGLHLALVDTLARPPRPAAWLMAGGVAAYLVGNAEYRRELGLGPWRGRLVAAACCAASGLVGLAAPTVVQLVVLVAVPATALVLEGRRS